MGAHASSTGGLAFDIEPGQAMYFGKATQDHPCGRP